MKRLFKQSGREWIKDELNFDPDSGFQDHEIFLSEVSTTESG